MKKLPEKGSDADQVLSAIIDAWLDETPVGKSILGFMPKDNAIETVRGLMEKGLLIIIQDNDDGFVLEPTEEFYEAFPSTAKH